MKIHTPLMNVPYKTLSYFCRSLTDPMFEIYDLLDDDKHHEHLNLLVSEFNTHRHR
jgi:hypothetical protein